MRSGQDAFKVGAWCLLAALQAHACIRRTAGLHHGLAQRSGSTCPLSMHTMQLAKRMHLCRHLQMCRRASRSCAAMARMSWVPAMQGRPCRSRRRAPPVTQGNPLTLDVSLDVTPSALTLQGCRFRRAPVLILSEWFRRLLACVWDHLSLRLLVSCFEQFHQAIARLTNPAVRVCQSAPSGHAWDVAVQMYIDTESCDTQPRSWRAARPPAARGARGTQPRAPSWRTQRLGRQIRVQSLSVPSQMHLSPRKTLRPLRSAARLVAAAERSQPRMPEGLSD